MADDIGKEVRGKLGALDQNLARADAAMAEAAAKLRALGDEAGAARVEIARERARHPGTVADAGEVDTATTSIDRQAAALKKVEQQELFNLEVLERQTVAYREQEALIGRLQGRPEQLALFERPVLGPQFPKPPATVAVSNQMVPTAELVAEREALAAIRAEQDQITLAAAREDAMRRQTLATLQAQARAEAQRARAVEGAGVQAYTYGYQRGAKGKLADPMGEVGGGYVARPDIEGWTRAESQANRLKMALGQYDALAEKTELSNTALSASFTRLGMAEVESSNALRRHGALTTEYLQALGRGETTVQEFGYQMGATIGKFAGWTTAAAATYGALGAVYEFGKGAVDAASGVQRLRRTISDIDPAQANKAIQGVARDTNVTVSEAADAMFQYSRVFHSVNDAAAAARTGLSALKLDNVSLADSVRLGTTVFQQFGLSAQAQVPLWNMLATGQREYNARISDTVPLLMKTMGAVRNAGGDINQLAQIAIVASRIYPGQGGQIATALARSASQNVPRNLGALRTQFGLGYGAEATDWTRLFQDAIIKSGSMSGDDRRRLIGLTMDPRWAARYAGLASPQAAQLMQQIQTGVTPETTQGAMQRELNTQLGTAREHFHALTVEMQNTGAALGASGIVPMLSGLIVALTKAGGAVRGVVDLFDSIPTGVQEATITLLAFRTAMLFFTRTRIGATAAQLVGLNRLPGFRGADDTTLRGELAAGNRAALNRNRAAIEAYNSQLMRTEEERNELGVKQTQAEARYAELTRAGLGEETAAIAALEESNALKVRLVELEAEQRNIEASRGAALGVQTTLLARQRGITATNRNDRYTDPELRALEAEVGATGAAGAAAVNSTALERKLAAEKARLAAAVAANAAADTELAAGGAAVLGSGRAAFRASGAAVGVIGLEIRAKRLLAAAKARLSVMFRADAVTDEALAAETTAAAGAAEVATITSTGMLARLGGFVKALDPWFIALLALPEAYGLVKGAFDRSSDATKQAHDALVKQEPGNAAEQQFARAADLQAAAAKQYHSDFWQTIGIGNVWSSVIDPMPEAAEPTTITQARKKAADAAKKAEQAAERTVDPGALDNLGNLYLAKGNQFRHDLQWLVKTREGRQIIGGDATALEQELQNAAWQTYMTGGANDPEGYRQAIAGIRTWFQQIYDSAIAPMKNLSDDIFGAFENLTLVGSQGTPAQLPAFTQAFEDKTKLFGFDPAEFHQAVLAYGQGARQAFEQLSKAKDPLDQAALDPVLQSVNQMQSNLVNSIQSAVAPDIARAASAQSPGEANKYLNDALSRVQSMKGALAKVLEGVKQQFKGNPKMVAAISMAIAALNQSTDDTTKSITDQYLADLKSIGDVAVSGMKGISPEADLARAKAVMDNAKKALAAGTAHHANASTMRDLQKAYNEAQNSYAKSQYDLGRGLIEARASLAQANIGGTNPEDDIRRAKVAIDYAQQVLDYDRRGGAGQKQIIQDQAAVQDAVNKYNSTAKSYDRDLMLAYQQLAVSRITGLTPADDVARAKLELDNANQTLAKDRAHGAGVKQLIQDQSDVNDKTRAYNQTLQSQYADQREVLQDRARLAAANIQGASPEAEAQRAKIELQAAIDTLAADRAHSAPLKQIIADQADIAEKRQQIETTAAQNARDIIEATGALRTSQITGRSPEAGIRRAGSDLDTALRLLAYDRKNHAGQKQLLADARDVQDKRNALNDARAQSARDNLEAAGELRVARVTGTDAASDVRRAKIELDNANRILAYDRAHHAGQKQIMADMADALNKRRALNEAMQSAAQAMASDAQDLIRSAGDLAASQTTDPIAQAAISLDTARQLLASINPSQFKNMAEYLAAVYQAQAAVNKAVQDYQSAIVTQDLSTLDFELHTQRISNEQYINGLEQLLKMKNLTLQQRQDLLTKLYDAQHSGEVSLNLGNIKMPTSFEVAKVIRNAVQGPVTAARDALASIKPAGGDGASIGDYTRTLTAAVPGATVTNTNSIVINVDKSTDMAAFAQALEEAVSGNFAAIRAAHP